MKPTNLSGDADQDAATEAETTALTLEMAAAVSERGFVMQRAMPIVQAAFDNGVNRGEVRIVGTRGKFVLVKRNNGSSDEFAVSPEYLRVTLDVAEHLQIAMSHIFRFRQAVAYAAAHKTGVRRDLSGRFAGHHVEPAGRR